MSDSEKSKYSLTRAINAAISGDWKGAGFEAEVSNDIAKRMGKSTQGFFMPTNIPFAQRSGYAVGTAGAGTTGGTLVATNLLAGSFIEVLRNKAKVLQLGATVLSGLVGNVDIPRQTGASNTFWVGENGTLTESEGTFDKVSLALKSIGTYSMISRNMLLQSTPDIEMLVRADLIAQLALGIDKAALSGSGSANQPTGITNTSGIGSVVGGTNGAAITIDHLIDLETAITSANAPEDSLAYLANARTIGALKKLKSTTGSYLWNGAMAGATQGTPGEINGYPVARSNQARGDLTKGTGTNLSEIIFGNWSEVLIGEWGVLEIMPNPYDATAYKQGAVLLRAMQSVDIAVRHAASFAVMSDAITG
jgi:HK97 family phage major capsid protein